MLRGPCLVGLAPQQLLGIPACTWPLAAPAFRHLLPLSHSLTLSLSQADLLPGEMCEEDYGGPEQVSEGVTVTPTVTQSTCCPRTQRPPYPPLAARLRTPVCIYGHMVQGALLVLLPRVAALIQVTPTPSHHASLCDQEFLTGDIPVEPFHLRREREEGEFVAERARSGHHACPSACIQY
jgi:hypothetical protein